MSLFVFSSRRRHTSCALVTGVQTCALPICGAVLDGRDIGTVIAPHADAKLFVTASPEQRARRRHAEMVARGVDVSFDAVLADVHARDARDTGRADAPLLRASDAMLLDNSDMDRDAAIAAAIAFDEGKAGKAG